MEESKDKSSDITKSYEDAKEDKKEKIQEPEILADLPPEVKKVIELGVSMQRFSGTIPNPIFSKINEKHIDKILEISQKEEENSYNDAQSTKRYNLVYFFIIIFFIACLIFYLVDKDKSLLLNILQCAGLFLGGFGGGYGFKAYFDNKKKNK